MSDPHPDAATVGGLPARRPSAILAELARLRHRDRGGSWPLVTLHLTSGRDVSGWIVDLVEGEALVLHVPGPNLRQPNWDVAYLEPRTIEAITVHDAPRAAAVLSSGKVPSSRPSPAAPSPTRLEVKRELAARQAAVADAIGGAVAFDVDWNAAPSEGEGLRALGELIAAAAAALVTVAREPLGRDALRARVERVVFGDEDQAGVSLSGKTLAIVARLPFGAEGRLSPSALLAAIEKVL